MTPEEQAAAAAAAKAAATAQPAAAPAATPAPAAAPAQQQAAPVVTQPEPVKVEVSTDQQTQLKNFVSQAGFDADSLTRDFMETGNIPYDLQAKLAEQHGEAVANMLVQQMVDQRDAQLEVNKASDQKLFKHIEAQFEGVTDQGGDKTWEELKTWAGQNMGDEKDEINNMLAEGGLAAQMAIDHMIRAFKSSDAFTQPAKLEEGGDRSNDNRGKPLTKAEYDSQLRELLKTKSYDSPEVQALGRRRSKAIGRGQ